MYEELIQRLREYPDREETAGGYVEVDWQDLLDAADAIESLTAQLAALQAENAELQRDAEQEHERYIETLGERDGFEARATVLGAALARVEAERDAYRALGTIEELSALVKARDEGLLLMLPCKPGTEIFGHCDIRGANPISRGYFYPPYIPKLGVDAWLTRAEAEAALGSGVDG